MEEIRLTSNPYLEVSPEEFIRNLRDHAVIGWELWFKNETLYLIYYGPDIWGNCSIRPGSMTDDQWAEFIAELMKTDARMTVLKECKKLGG